MRIKVDHRKCDGWLGRRQAPDCLFADRWAKRAHILLDENYLSRDECKYLVSLNKIFGVPTLTRITTVRE